MSSFKNIKYYFIFIFAINCLDVKAQQDTFSSGMIFEDEIYETLQRTEPDDGAKADLPSWVNLERFCPTVRNQGKISSCVGWSTGYGAMTIQRAILSNCVDKKKINQNAHSALFLFNQIKKGDCIRGSKISDALEFLKSNGNCLAGHFDLDINDCGRMPNEKVKKLAKRFAIEDYLTLFGIKDEPGFKVFQVKKTLAQKRPVIIGMSVKRNFYELKDAKIWHSNIGNTAPAGGHAMVVVGYDDRKEAFRLFNSWGKEWGNDGFIWVKYKDFGKYCKYGYVMYLMKKPLLEEKQVKLAANVLAGRGGSRNSLMRTRTKRPGAKKPRPKARPAARPSGNQQKNNAKPRKRPSQKPAVEAIDSKIAEGNIEKQNSTRTRKNQENKPKNTVPDNRLIRPKVADNQQVRESEETTLSKSEVESQNTEDVSEKEPATENSEQEKIASSESEEDTPTENEEESEDEEMVEDEEVSAEELEAELDEILEIQPLLEFSGDFVFREFTGFNEQSSQPEFAVADVKLENDVFKTTREFWEIGQRFQLLASTKSEEQYLYIFSIDAEKNVHFHWPRQEGLNEKFSGENRTALMMNNGSDVTIPGPNKVLKLANAGTDRLVVLFSKKKIKGLKQLAEISSKKSGEFMTAFRHTLGDYAVPRSDIRYFSDRIGFEATTRGKGYIVPLVLEVSTQ